MESILYNTEKKEVALIFGYGIGNHLSINYLTGIINDIRKVFPKLKDSQLNELVFLEVNRSSRRHRNMWYTRFTYDMSGYDTDKWGAIIMPKGCVPRTAYAISSHTKGVDGWMRDDEIAERVMDRLIHD